MKTTLTTFVLAAVLALSAIPVHAQTVTPSPSTAPAPDYLAQISGTSDPIGDIATAIDREVTSLGHMNYQTVGSVARALWKDPTKAQAICDRLAERAAPIFVAYGGLSGPLAYISPTQAAKLPQPPPGYSYQVLPPTATASDGSPCWAAGQRSVTITYTAPAASPSPSPTASPSASPSPTS